MKQWWRSKHLKHSLICSCSSLSCDYLYDYLTAHIETHVTMISCWFWSFIYVIRSEFYCESDCWWCVETVSCISGLQHCSTTNKVLFSFVINVTLGMNISDTHASLMLHTVLFPITVSPTLCLWNSNVNTVLLRKGLLWWMPSSI